MFGFIKTIGFNAITRSQDTEVVSMVNCLAAMDTMEIMPLLPPITKVRLDFLSNGIDFLDPFLVMRTVPDAPARLSKVVTQSMRDKNYEGGNVLAVWMFTLRGAENPHLRAAARLLWGQLARAFPLIRAGAAANNPWKFDKAMALEMTSMPRGFEPIPPTATED